MNRRSPLPRPVGKWRAGSPGIALILTMLLVGLLFVMALALLSLSSSDYQSSNNGSLSIQALYNADAGIEEAKMRVSPATVAPAAAAGVNIPYFTFVDWRAYVYSGDQASPSEADMKAAIQALDPTYGKKVWDTTQTEGDSHYKFFNTVQASNKIKWGWARIHQKVDSSGNPIYINVSTNAETTAATTTIGGTPINNLPVLVVTSEGIKSSVRRMIEMQLQPIKSTSTTTTTTVVDPFGNGAYGKEGVTMSGNNGSTDSYDSALGAYGGGNRGNSGDVVTDSTAAGAISVGNNTVDGKARIGVGGDTGTGITTGPGGTISGTSLANANVTTPPITIPTSGVVDKGAVSLTASTAGGSGKKDTTTTNPCAGATMVLTEGTYKMSSLSISGQGSLCTEGKVIIYVDGNIDIGGNGVLNASALPTNLLIYATNNCTSVSVHGNGNFYGAVYAPNAAITINGSPSASMYGAATGKNVTITGNGAFHYDVALGRVGEWETSTTSTTYTISGYSRYAWREIPF